MANLGFVETTETYVEPLPEDKARRTLERINLLSKIREEILPHPQLEERLRLCQLSADVPDWWVAGKHDKDLLVGVAKHGLGRTDFFILNDPELSFREIVRKNMISVKTEGSSNALKLERPEDILKLDRNEILVKLEKGEGTLKIEKIGSTPLKVEAPSEEDILIKQETAEVKNEETKPEISVPIIGESKHEIAENEKSQHEIAENEKELGDSKAPSEKEDAPTDKLKCDLESVSTEKTDITLNSSVEQMQVEPEPESEGTKQGTDSQISENESICDNSEKLVNPPDSSEPKSSEMEVDQQESKADNQETADQIESSDVKNDIDTDVVKLEEPLAIEKEANDKKNVDVKVETGSVKSESDKNSTKEEVRAESSASSDGKANVSSGNTEVERFKAMFPELEVMHKFPEIDTTVVADKQSTIAQLLQQSYQNPIKWPKDHALQVRLQHIVHCVEHKEWPASRAFSAYTSGAPTTTEPEQEREQADTPTSTPRSTSEGSEVITITTDLASRQAHQPPAKRKRHIAIDVETERAKLHALLNSTSMQMSHMMKHSPATPWDNDESLSEDSRRSTPVTSALQPPPAHQQSHQSTRVLSMPFDLKYHGTPPTPLSTPIPGTATTLTPIDLSSSVKTSSDSGRASTSKDLSSSGMDEVQDFSMPNKNKQPQQTKSKLDDMLNKLMQRKNCPVPIEEPVIGKEKKKRKLDEIVLGLSAAKEQQNEPKKSQPSVSVTVTKSPVASTKSPFLSQAEQHNLILKQQQQLQQQLLQQQQAIKMSQPNSASAAHVQRKTYEAMIADISKVADFSAKISSYSHEAKVNKWLAEQTSMMPEQSLGADFMSAPRRRRPRVDPTLLDWKKLTGEENVSVINRMTGKKLTGNKAPQLKRLAQWLLENPMYDIDPKWAELVKERGNLPHDLQKRLPQTDRKKGPGRPPLLNSPPGSQSSTTQSTTLPTANLPFPSLASGLGGINPSTLLSGLSLGGFDPKNNPLLLPFGGMSNMSALSGMSGLGNMGLTNSLFANLASLGLPSLAGMDSSSLNPATSTSSETKAPKAHKADSKTSKSTPVSSSASTLPTSLPFFFPNPSLLYTPLGLGGLNPFSLQPGSMTSAYDSLALLNGGLGVNSTQAQNRAHKNSSSTTSVSSGRASTVTSASTSQGKQQQQHQRLPAQFLLPHDTHLLESLTRPPKSKQSRPSSSYLREQEMKDALETLSKSSTDLFPRMPHEDRTPKRTREEAFTAAPVDMGASKRSPSPLAKKSKESPVPSPSSKASIYSGGLDLSSYSIPEEKPKTPLPPPPVPEIAPIVSEKVPVESVNPVAERPVSPECFTQESVEPEERAEDLGEDEPSANEENSLLPSETKDDCGEGEGESAGTGGKGKKRRGKKSLDVGQRKMLRSSAGRAAAAAQRAREEHSN